MKKSYFIILISGAFFIGMIISAVVVRIMWEHSRISDLALSAASEASMDMMTLECLQTGGTNRAVELLNGDLDSQVIILGNCAEYHSFIRRDQKLMGLLRRVREYRVKHPYKESQNGQILMKRAFDLLDDQNPH